MNSIDRENFAHLLQEAGIKPRLRRELRFVPEQIETWEDRDFIAITTKAGTEGVIIAPLASLYVVSFRLHKRTTPGRNRPIICDFCATWQPGNDSAVISFDKGRSSVSYLCCADLLCSLHVRDKTTQAKRSRTQLRENTTLERRIVRLHGRLETKLKTM